MNYLHSSLAYGKYFLLKRVGFCGKYSKCNILEIKGFSFYILLEGESKNSNESWKTSIFTRESWDWLIFIVRTGQCVNIVCRYVKAGTPGLGSVYKSTLCNLGKNSFKSKRFGFHLREFALKECFYEKWFSKGIAEEIKSGTVMAVLECDENEQFPGFRIFDHSNYDS